MEAIGYIWADMDNATLEAFAGDRRKRWQVERGLEIVSEASRHPPETLKARHPKIPWRKVAGIGNVLRHEYARVAADALWRLVRDDLNALRWSRCAARNWRPRHPLPKTPIFPPPPKPPNKLPRVKPHGTGKGMADT